jgi:hypothetical protein
VTGRHDASRILEPFLDALATPRRPYRMAVLLHDAGSLNKVTQTLIELVRGGIETLPLEMTVFCRGRTDELDAAFAARLPFAVRASPMPPRFSKRCERGASTTSACSSPPACTRGEDLLALASHLTVGRLDAVWGSRRCRFATSTSPTACAYKSKRAAGRHQLRGQPRCSASRICSSTGATFPTRCRRCGRSARRTRSRPASI